VNFFPLGTAIKTDDSIAQVGTYEGDERPESKILIEDLKKVFRAKKEEFKAIAIFYDVSVVDPNTNERQTLLQFLLKQKSKVHLHILLSL